MKKVFYLVAATLFIGMSATANETNIQESSVDCITEISLATAWEDDGVVSGLKFFGRNIKGTTPGEYKIQYNSSTGAYRIYFKGSWYNVQSSDRSDFRYMFYADKTYYFNH